MDIEEYKKQLLLPIDFKCKPLQAPFHNIKLLFDLIIGIIAIIIIFWLRLSQQPYALSNLSSTNP
jgi:hypothetical protein